MFDYLDQGELSPHLLQEYRNIIMGFQHELIRRGLRAEYLDRFVTVHYLPHSGGRQRLFSHSSDNSDNKDENNYYPQSTMGDNFQCSSSTYPNYSHYDNTRANRLPMNDKFAAILADFKRMQNSINTSIATSSSSTTLPPALPLRSSVAPENVPQYVAALSGATTLLSQLGQYLSSSHSQATASNDPLSDPNVNSLCQGLLNQLLTILSSSNTTSLSTNVVDSLPQTVCSTIPLYQSIPPQTSLQQNFQPPIVNTQQFGALPYNMPPAILPPYQYQQQYLHPLYSIEKVIPKFTAPYHLWAAQIRKLLYSKGFVNLRDPQLTSTVGASILNRLPSGVAIAAPWTDVETLLQFLEKYDKSKRDVCDIVARDGKFNNKPSIHFFLKCTEIQQADTTNLSPHQIQSFAWQSMQRLFPADMKSYIAMVSQGAALPSQEQWDTIDRLWNDSSLQRKQDSQRITVTTSNIQSQVTKAESVTQVTSPLEQAIYTLTQSLSKFGKFNNNKKEDNKSKSFKKQDIVGLTLKERGTDLRRFPQPRYPDRRDLCFYHQIYGPAALKCHHEGCQWDQNARKLKNKNKTPSSKN